MTKFLECTERGTVRKILIPVNSVIRIESKQKGDDIFATIFYADTSSEKPKPIDTWEAYEKIKSQLFTFNYEEEVQRALAVKEAELLFKRKSNGIQ